MFQHGITNKCIFKFMADDKYHVSSRKEINERETRIYKEYLLDTTTIKTIYTEISDYIHRLDVALCLQSLFPALFPLILNDSMRLGENGDYCIISKTRLDIDIDVNVHIVAYDNIEIFSFEGCAFAHFLRYLVLLSTNCAYNIGGVYLHKRMNPENIQIGNIIVGNRSPYSYSFMHSTRISDSLTSYYCPFYTQLPILGKCDSIRMLYYKLFEDRYNEKIREYMYVDIK